MADQKRGTEVQLKNMKIPYYSPRFECLRDMLDEYKNISGKQTVQWQAQWNAVIGGIQYYYEIIQEEESQREQGACNMKGTNVLEKLCSDLVESMNRAIYCLIDTRYIALSSSENDGDQKSEDINKKLCPYREYLQWICNNFMKDKENHERLIIKVSLDLLKNRVSMDTLFSEAHAYETQKKTPSLCVVFYPSHDELEGAYKYLPMLTHEISHHFRYIDSRKRNRILLRYLLDQLCTHMTASLFQMVSEKGNHVMRGEAEAMLAWVMKNTLRKCFEDKYGEFMQQGHLVQMKDYLYQFFYDMVGKGDIAEKIYKNGAPVFLILKEAFCGLAFVTDMSWYVTEENKEDCTEEELLLSRVLDILSSSETPNTVRKKELEKALRALVFRVGEAVENKFSRGDVGDEIKKLRLEVYKSWFCDYSEFKGKLEQLRRKMTSKNEQGFYDFFDICVTIKNYIDNILYICAVGEAFFVRTKTAYPILTKVFEALRRKVKTVLERKGERPTLEKAYLSNRMIHSEIVQMGLLDEREDVFVSMFLKLFSDWDMNLFSHMLDEYMKVYEEVFADLGMCAAFGFDQVGYANYIIEKFSYEQEPGKRLEKDMTRERLRLVLSILEKSSSNQKLAINKSGANDGIGGTEQRWKEEIERLMEKRPIEGKYDGHFKDVFENHIIKANWVKACRENDVIQAIGRHYNSSYKEDDNEKEKMEKKFSDDFKKRNDKREEKFNKIEEKGPETAIHIMLQEVDEHVKL